MANRTTFSGLAAQLAALCFLATAACAAPTGIENEEAGESGEPAPVAESSVGANEVTGLAPSAGGATGSGGSSGAAGAAGAAGAGGDAGGGGAGGGPTGTPGLEGAWSFEDVGALTTKDGSGNSHNGSLVGSGVSIVAGGKTGSAASFSGGDGRISIPGASSLDFMKAATIELWVKLSAATPGAIVARVGSSGGGVRVRTSQGNVQVAFTRAGGSAIAISDIGVLSGWTHVAAVNDGVSLKLYINGKLHRTETGGQLGYVSGDLYVGKSGTDSALNGYVDELKWWSIARTNEEICSDAAGSWVGGECVL